MGAQANQLVVRNNIFDFFFWSKEVVGGGCWRFFYLGVAEADVGVEEGFAGELDETLGGDNNLVIRCSVVHDFGKRGEDCVDGIVIG